MTPVHKLYIVIEDLLYSNNNSIAIVMPYWNVKKDIGPKLVHLLKIAGFHRLKSTPTEWVVMTPKGHKRIIFTTTVSGHTYSDLIIIPDDREEIDG